MRPVLRSANGVSTRAITGSDAYPWTSDGILSVLTAYLSHSVYAAMNTPVIKANVIALAVTALAVTAWLADATGMPRMTRPATISRIPAIPAGPGRSPSRVMPARAASRAPVPRPIG